MIKVITYGTYDLLHYGHIRLLERAKALGDWLIVGVTTDDFDKQRGKINVQQSLMERIEAVRATGLADEIIIEEYEGQKIDDIKKYNIDIFTVGSDWVDKFGYLEEYCKVVYLERTQGISSSQLRVSQKRMRLGLVGESTLLPKFERESHYVNGMEAAAICTSDSSILSEEVKNRLYVTDKYMEMLEHVDALYIVSHPAERYQQIKVALEQGKHVLCESPVAMHTSECRELFQLAAARNCILMESVKTAYSTAYYRLLLLIKGGSIGQVVSVDSTCTSQRNVDFSDTENLENIWNSICTWGPTAMLPIFHILGTDYVHKQMVSKFVEPTMQLDAFTKADFIYPCAVASLKVGRGVKSEGELIVSGTKGYVYVPAPWWKTDYFEIRYENQENNKRYFYQLDGEGIRYELVMFLKSIEGGKASSYIDKKITESIVRVIEDFYDGTGLKTIG